MPPSDFANADINGTIDKLSTEEAVRLTAGVGLWHTAAVERLGIPAIKVGIITSTCSCYLTKTRSVMAQMVRGAVLVVGHWHLVTHTYIYLRHPW